MTSSSLSAEIKKEFREYKGLGEIITPSGKRYAGKFQIVQLTDGLIKGVFKCDGSSDLGIEISKEFKGLVSGKFRLEGSSSRQEKISAEVFINGLSHGDVLTVKFHGLSLTRISKSKLKPLRLHFGITNFQFDRCVFEDNNVKIGFIKIRGYGSILEALELNGGVLATSMAIVELLKDCEMKDLENLIDDICLLLSFARATEINWIYYDVFSNDGQLLMSYHRDIPTRRFRSGDPLIGIFPSPAELSPYLRKCFDNYRIKKKDLGLDLTIGYYLEAKSFNTLEVKYLSAFTALEVLNSRYIIKRNILPKASFESLKNKVKSLVEELSDAAVFEKALIIEKVSDLNRFPLRHCLKEMFDQLSITISDENLQRLIQIRNKIIHKGSPEGAHFRYADYSLLISILDKSILKILGYDGYYLDRLNQFNRVKI
jgi:hypothetical protein